MKIKVNDIKELFSNYKLVDDGETLTPEMVDKKELIYACLSPGKFIVQDEADRQIFTFIHRDRRANIWEIDSATDNVDILDADATGDDEDSIGIDGCTPLGEQLEDEDDEELATYDDLSLVMDNVLKDVKMYQNALKRKEIKGSAKKYQNESMQLDEALDTLSNAGYTVTKKNKYNYYPKNTGMSTKQCMKYVLEKHKKVFDYLKDK